AVRLIGSALKRVGRRNGWLRGRYNGAGSGVWLMTKISANPHGIPAAATGAAVDTATGLAPSEVAQGAVSAGLIDIDEGTSKRSWIETPSCGFARGGAKTATERAVGCERCDAAAEAAHVSRAMRERVDTVGDEFPGATRGAHDYGASGCHPLGDDQSEWLRLRARMDDHVECAHRAGGVIDEPRQTDTICQAERGDSLLEIGARVLTARGVVQRVADDVGPDGRVMRQRAQRLKKRVMPLPAPERRHQADANRTRRRERQRRQP